MSAAQQILDFRAEDGAGRGVHDGAGEFADAAEDAALQDRAFHLYQLQQGVGERVVAFTIGSEITEDTFDVHIEKAFPDVDGAYPMINQQFVKNELSKYEYVNREEDLGEPGLRKAKQSYRPVMMVERYIAAEKNDRAI